jgi:hypothetical protein
VVQVVQPSLQDKAITAQLVELLLLQVQHQQVVEQVAQQPKTLPQLEQQPESMEMVELVAVEMALMESLAQQVAQDQFILSIGYRENHGT